MTISYDAYVMQQLVAACQTANDEIVKAQQLITSVKSHADWTCKEKSVIDELMEECKKLINRMQEDENNFLHVLKEVEGELDTAESSISSLFQGVESILAKVLAIPVGVATTVGTGLLNSAGNALGQIFGGTGDAATSIADQMMDQFNPDHVGTGGWIGDSLESFQEWVQDIGSDIVENDNIWHGPLPITTIPQIELPDISDVIVPQIRPDIGDVISIWDNDVIQPVGDVVNSVWESIPIGEALNGTSGEIIGHDIGEAVQWFQDVISVPIPICRIADIEL